MVLSPFHKHLYRHTWKTTPWDDFYCNIWVWSISKGVTGNTAGDKVAVRTLYEVFSGQNSSKFSCRGGGLITAMSLHDERHTRTRSSLINYVPGVKGVIWPFMLIVYNTAWHAFGPTALFGLQNNIRRVRKINSNEYQHGAAWGLDEARCVWDKHSPWLHCSSSFGKANLVINKGKHEIKHIPDALMCVWRRRRSGWIVLEILGRHKHSGRDLISFTGLFLTQVLFPSILLTIALCMTNGPLPKLYSNKQANSMLCPWANNPVINHEAFYLRGDIMTVTGNWPM